VCLLCISLFLSSSSGGDALGVAQVCGVVVLFVLVVCVLSPSLSSSGDAGRGAGMCCFCVLCVFFFNASLTVVLVSVVTSCCVGLCRLFVLCWSLSSSSVVLVSFI